MEKHKVGTVFSWCHRVRRVPHPSEDVSLETAWGTLTEAPETKAQDKEHRRGKCTARG